MLELELELDSERFRLLELLAKNFRGEKEGGGGAGGGHVLPPILIKSSLINNEFSANLLLIRTPPHTSAQRKIKIAI